MWTSLEHTGTGNQVPDQQAPQKLCAQCYLRGCWSVWQSQTQHLSHSHEPVYNMIKNKGLLTMQYLNVGTTI